MERDPEIITASELAEAEWVYSREEWERRRLDTAKPDQARLDARRASMTGKRGRSAVAFPWQWAAP